MSTFTIFIAVGCVASTAAADQSNATALALSNSGFAPAPLAGPIVYLGSGAASPCGGDIALPATTNSLVNVFTCADRLDYNLQLTLTSNPSASAWGIYIAWGDACSSPTPPPGTFFPEVSAVATTANPTPFLTGFCLTNLCCGAYSCRAPPCGTATVAVDYTAPSTAVCAVNNREIAAFYSSSSRVLGATCINVANKYELSFTLSNPSSDTLSVFLASGESNCGLFYNFDTLLPANGGVMPPGFTPAASAIATDTNSFQLTSRCTDEPCCAIVWCVVCRHTTYYTLPPRTNRPLTASTPLPTHSYTGVTLAISYIATACATRSLLIRCLLMRRLPRASLRASLCRPLSACLRLPSSFGGRASSTPVSRLTPRL